MTIIEVNDCTHVNLPHTPTPPRGLLAGYTTGTHGVQWTADDFKAHPNAVRICQDVDGTDGTADVFDVETGAGILRAIPGWVHRAQESFKLVRRRGQRRPTIYTSASNVTAVVNELIAGGIHSDVRLWVAHFGVPRDHAVQTVAQAGGPFPIVGFQYANGLSFDRSVFSEHWLTDQSGAQPPAHPASGFDVTSHPPGKWSGPVTVTGRGPEGHHVWKTTTHDGRNWTPPEKL